MLSILCLTKGEPFTGPFLVALTDVARQVDAECVIAVDGPEDAAATVASVLSTARVVRVRTQGYLESGLDAAVAACHGRHILRMDDDERCSPAMVEWLRAGAYRADTNWKFPRAHFWGDTGQVLMNAPLWPDHQTRLSVREKAADRTSIHAGSPWGGGTLAPVLIEHHKFLVRPRDEREAIVRRYDSLQPGAGHNFRAFSVPEAVFETFATEPIERVTHAALSDALTVRA